MAAAILAAAALHRVHDEPRRNSGNGSGIESPAAKGHHASEDLEIESWDSERTSHWLTSHGLPAEVVCAAREADVDGATLQELNHKGWAELGCEPP